MANTLTPTRPEWADAKNITRIFGIGKSTLYRLEAEGKIRSSSLRERGKLRGKKLFSCDSVAAYIEKMSNPIKDAEPRRVDHSKITVIS